jgi:glc operon protein GlcG
MRGTKMMSYRGIALTALVLLIFSGIADAQVIEKKSIGLALAQQVAAAAEAEAVKNKWNVVISIVDEGGHLVYLQRMDNTQTGSIDVAIQKAKAAVSFKRPTKVYEDMVAGGRTAILSLPGVIAIEGGVPLMVKDHIIGAIGVSGVKSAEDGQIAKAGADILKGL